MAEGFVVAAFENVAALENAIGVLRGHGYRAMDAWTPYPVESVEEALALPPSKLPRWTLLGGVVGGVVGYGVQVWTNVLDFPVEVGGMPPHAPLAFLPIAFETAILFAVVSSLVGFLVNTCLPAWWHPAFEVAGIAAATDNRYYLLVSTKDAHWREPLTEEHLRQCQAIDVRTVHP